MHNLRLKFFLHQLEGGGGLGPPSGYAYVSDFSEILYEEAERHAVKGHVTKSANFKNPRWWPAAILKIVKSPYISEKSSDFDEIW